MIANGVKAILALFTLGYVPACIEIAKGTIYLIIAKAWLSPKAIQVIIFPVLLGDFYLSYTIGHKLSDVVHWVSGHYIPDYLILPSAGLFTLMTFGAFAWNLIIYPNKSAQK